MATITRHFCDGCGAEVQAARTALEVTSGPHRHREPVTLCVGCAGRFFGEFLAASGRASAREPAGSAS